MAISPGTAIGLAQHAVGQRFGIERVLPQREVWHGFVEVADDGSDAADGARLGPADQALVRLHLDERVDSARACPMTIVLTLLIFMFLFLKI